MPTAISGAPLERIAHRAVLFVEQYTGLTVGSVSIAERFQPTLVHLTIADLLPVMNVLGADVSSFSLGDLSVSKGGKSNLMEASDHFKMMAMSELNAIGKTARFQKAFV